MLPEQDEGENRGEKGRPICAPFAYPSLLPHAPSLAPALQDWVIGLFRDNISRARKTNLNYCRLLCSLWERFERALPLSLSPSLPFLTPQALCHWLLETPQVQAIFYKW